MYIPGWQPQTSTTLNRTHVIHTHGKLIIAYNIFLIMFKFINTILKPYGQAVRNSYV